jgi:2-polyprenyl-3-methyl-5-hydroxy-6-metoxy-1,4-benzoquinol methylase
MTALVEQLDYETKAGEYFGETRPEMLPFVPENCRRLLDVGCGMGAFGASLKQTRQIEVWGVELVSSVAAIAKTKLDRVITGLFEPETELPGGAFDCIVFNDVLEHMIAPEQAIRYAKTLLAPGGAVLASIPNVRTLPVLWQLVVRGRWEYGDCGLLDKTHLRFFTRSSILKMFEDEGYTVKSILGINPYRGVPNVSRHVWRAHKVAHAISLGKFTDMKFQQFAVVAVPARPSSLPAAPVKGRRIL